MNIDEETIRTILHEHIIGLLKDESFEIELCENIIDDLKRKESVG